MRLLLNADGLFVNIKMKKYSSSNQEGDNWQPLLGEIILSDNFSLNFGADLEKSYDFDRLISSFSSLVKGQLNNDDYVFENIENDFKIIFQPHTKDAYLIVPISNIHEGPSHNELKIFLDSNNCQYIKKYLGYINEDLVKGSPDIHNLITKGILFEY